MDVFGLLGNPVGHSLSPPMHEAAYETVGMDARYVTFEPEPAALDAAIRGAKALGVAGLNVTIPYKRDVREFVEPDALASRIGAVNTIDFDGTPTGHNTDAGGAIRALRDGGVDPAGTTAVVVGAGGAGRAIAFGLADAGATVRIANRTESRAQELGDAISNASAHGLDALTELLADADVLVNATSVGMDEDASPVPASALHDELVVMDAVYSPLETRLLREADERGATTVDGGRMLLYQGVEAFELWTGEPAPVAEMDAALRVRL